MWWPAYLINQNPRFFLFWFWFGGCRRNRLLASEDTPMEFIRWEGTVERVLGVRAAAPRNAKKEARVPSIYNPDYHDPH